MADEKSHSACAFESVRFRSWHDLPRVDWLRHGPGRFRQSKVAKNEYRSDEKNEDRQDHVAMFAESLIPANEIPGTS